MSVYLCVNIYQTNELRKVWCRRSGCDTTDKKRNVWRQRTNGRMVSKMDRAEMEGVELDGKIR